MVLLIRSLRTNGVFSLVSGLAAVVFAEGLADAMSVPSGVLYFVGFGVLGFGALILWMTRSGSTSQGFALAVVLADIGWVIGALGVLVIPGSMESKWILAAISVPVAVFAVAQTIGLIRATSDNPESLSESIVINAPASAVWSELVDFNSYPQWNPFIVSISGDHEVGSALNVQMRRMRFRPTVTESESGQKLEWFGHLGPAGLFDGRHRFEMEGSGSGTRFRQTEEFTGILVPLFRRSFRSRTRGDFEAMNSALKSRVEARAQNRA